MKNNYFPRPIIFLFALILSSNLAFAQWSNWQTDRCHKGIEYRVKSEQLPSGNYAIEIEFRNRYREKAWIYYDIKIGSRSVTGRTDVNPGQTSKSFVGNYGSSRANIRIDKMRLRRDDLSPPKSCD
jgi:hypothetical protein